LQAEEDVIVKLAAARFDIAAHIFRIGRILQKVRTFIAIYIEQYGVLSRVPFIFF